MTEASVATPVAPAVPAAPSAPAIAPATPAEGGDKTAPNPAGTAPATPTGDEKTLTTPDPAEKRGTSRFERRISRLHREAAEARAERDLLRRQLDEVKPKAPESGAPRLEDYKDIEEYASAKAKFEADRTLKEHTSKQQGEAQRRYAAKLTETWEANVSKVEGKYEDFDEIVGDLQPTNPLTVALMEADNGPDIAYHLGKNPQEAKRIASLPPSAQFREIGKLEYKLSQEPPKAKTPSKAPAPITPLTGTTPAATGEPSESDDMKTWMKKRQKQVHAR